jgi:hypothetical protein
MATSGFIFAVMASAKFAFTPCQTRQSFGRPMPLPRKAARCQSLARGNNVGSALLRERSAGFARPISLPRNTGASTQTRK